MGISSQTTVANRHSYEHSFTNEYDQDQDGATIVTPDTGKSIAVKGVYVGTQEATSGRIRLYFETDEEGAENTVYVSYAADENPGYVPLNLVGDPNTPLKVESTYGASENYFLLVNYSQE